MGHSVLLVPVPALEPWVRGRWTHYEPSWVSTDPDFTHAHVTVLAPFIPTPTAHDLDAVAAIAATLDPLDVTYRDVATFPDGTIHVLPDPAAPFATLTSRLVAAFPECPPYDGAFADPVPHVTLDHTLAGVSEKWVRADLSSVLPVTARADRLELHWYGEGECRVLHRWPLGAASRLSGRA